MHATKGTALTVQCLPILIAIGYICPFSQHMLRNMEHVMTDDERWMQ